MTFSEGGQFEGGRVRSRRGGAAAGGGIGLLAVVAFLVYQLTGTDVSPLLDGTGTAPGTAQEQEDVVGDCTAEQANTDPRCRLSATVQTLDAYWEQAFAERGATLRIPDVVEFTEATTSGCGRATSSTGPFYCPRDETIYLDLTFFAVLQERFGASDGPLAEMYVTAHEYGHHVQSITGTLGSADRTGSGAGSDSVRIELQADCYAGLWAGHASRLVDPDTGTTFLEPITDAELADALSAAEAVGDDHIQERSGGQVDPHTWTHGSSEQRRQWFTTGYEQGTFEACDTFAADEL